MLKGLRMDWFEKLTGFRESDYATTKARLELVNGKLRSRVNGKAYDIGKLELVRLADLRQRAQGAMGPPQPSTFTILRGDVRAMHRAPEHAGALFQVASQFNLLEMTGPTVTPEHGVTRYQDDPTQGPACAIAAGAATIYRNYFAEVDGIEGQTRERQLDALALVGKYLRKALGKTQPALWHMRNGYAMCTPDGLASISAHLATLDPKQKDDLRALLCIGVHTNVQVTDVPSDSTGLVSQAFCSALPVAYAEHPNRGAQWAPFATLILEAAYEATLWAAVLNAKHTGSRTVLLTRLGGGAFGNEDKWINTALRRALEQTRMAGLDIRLVSFRAPSAATLTLAA
jgi:hypothetical protein